MFYAHIILAKKGPLARVWLAAHWDKKITKAHVFETNIEKSVEGIMQPKVKLALRTSGHLLLGVVRIYSRKAKYLLADCNEAFVKIKMAFRPGIVDLPEGHKEANVNAITLPEVFHDFDTALPELNDIDLEAQFSINQSRADEITMREDYGSLSLSLHDEGFGDIGFEGETPDLMRGTLESNANDQTFQNEDGHITETNIDKVGFNEDCLTNARLDADNFIDDFEQPELFEGDLFADPHMEKNSNKPEPTQLSTDEPFVCDMNRFDSGGPISPASSCDSFAEPVGKNDDAEETLKKDESTTNDDVVTNLPLNQSTLLQNEEESFALAPIDATAFRGVTKNKRKRKLIVDEIKNISGEEMKAQLASTSDIVTTLDLAPPTKRLMYWKETGGVEKLFSLPARSISARAMFANYQRHLTFHITQLEDFSCLGSNDILALDQIQMENEVSLLTQKRGGRKRKQDGQNVLTPRNENLDLTQQNISTADQIRDNHSSIVSQASLDIHSGAHDSAIQTHEAAIFDNIRSPGQMFSMNEINSIDQIGSLNDIPFTPGNLHHGIDDDFNQGNLTPADLHHGGLTPHHSTIENIESIPNLPADQISHILNAAENMAPNSNLCQMANVNTSSEIASDWNDYDMPVSINLQNVSDEQMENETDEQFEERVLNKRAAQLFYAIKTRIIKQDFLCLSELTMRNSRKQAAQKFYSLLVLKKFRALDIVQSAPYGDINVYRGPMFDNPKL